MKVSFDIDREELIKLLVDLNSRGDFNIEIPDTEAIKKEVELEKLLSKRVHHLFCVRTSKALWNAGIRSVKDLVKIKSADKLKEIHGIGNKGFTQIDEFMYMNNLSFDMDV